MEEANIEKVVEHLKEIIRTAYIDGQRNGLLYMSDAETIVPSKVYIEKLSEKGHITLLAGLIMQRDAQLNRLNLRGPGENKVPEKNDGTRV